MSLLLAVQQPVATGNLAVTLDNLTLSASGQVLLQGSSSITLGPITSSAAAAVLIQGTSANTLGGISLTAAGAVLIQGDLVTDGGFPVAASVTSTTTNAVTTHPIAMPATTVVGDLLMVIWHLSRPSNNTPSGWTKSFSRNNVAGLTSSFEIWTKVADGTEGGTTVNWTTAASADSAAQVYRITSWFGNLALGLDFATQVEGNSASPNPQSPPVTPWGVKNNFWIAMAGIDVVQDNTNTYPTNYVNGVNTQAPIVHNTVTSATRNLASNSDNPSAFAMATGGGWIAMTVAVRPALIVAYTLGNVTLSGTGGVEVKGTLTKTLDAVTLTADGTVGSAGINGSLTVTLDAVTLASTGTVLIQGTATPTLGAVTLSGTGKVDVKGTSTVTLGALTTTATASVLVTGTDTTTLGAASLTASGGVAVQGTATKTLNPVTSSATGGVEVKGTETTTLAPISISATGTVANPVSNGDLAQTLAPVALSATGTVTGLVVSLRPVGMYGKTFYQFKGNYFFRNREAIRRALARFRNRFKPDEPEPQVEEVIAPPPPPPKISGTASGVVRKAEVLIPAGKAKVRGLARVAKVERTVTLAYGRASRIGKTARIVRKSAVLQPLFKYDESKVAEWEAIEAMLIEEMVEEEDEFV